MAGIFGVSLSRTPGISTMIKSQAGGPVHQGSQGHTTALVPTPAEDPWLIEHNHDPCPVLSTPIFALLPMKPESEQGVQPSTHQACHQPAKGHCTRGFESPVRLEAEEPHHSTCNSSRSSGSKLHSPSTTCISDRSSGSDWVPSCCRQNPPSAGRQCGLEAELQSAICY